MLNLPFVLIQHDLCFECVSLIQSLSHADTLAQSECGLKVGRRMHFGFAAMFHADWALQKMLSFAQRPAEQLQMLGLLQLEIQRKVLALTQWLAPARFF